MKLTTNPNFEINNLAFELMEGYINNVTERRKFQRFLDLTVEQTKYEKRQTAEEIFKDLDNLVWGKEQSWNLSQWNAIKQKYLQNQERDSPKGIGTDNNESLPDEVKK